VKRPPDFSIYLRAVPLLARTPSVFVAPLLGAVVALVLSQLDSYATSPLGGAGGGIFTFIADVLYSFAFGIAIIHADVLERGLKANFDTAWEEGRRKAGGILLAAVGFWFIVNIAQLIGAMLSPTVELLLLFVAAFFLIYTIPAAAIGGFSSQFALSASIRAVRSDVFRSIVLAVAFVVLFIMLPTYLVGAIAAHYALTGTVVQLLYAFFQAIALGYLAFPFAKQYADVAFRV
jgi:hypothetical protein